MFKALLFCAALEAGFLSGGLYNYTELNDSWDGVGALYTTMDAKVQSGIVYVGGQMDSYFTPLRWNMFSPFQMTFVFRAGLDFGNAEIGYEHSCFHPLNPLATAIGYEIKPKYEGGYNKFFARIETK